MMLIIFVGLIANSALLSGACDVAPPKLDNFDWNKMADDRPWYVLLHESNDFENNLDCPLGTFASPQANVSLLTNVAYDIGTQNYVQYQGFVRNWDKTGYFEVIHQVSLWTGNYRVLAVDYDRYFIAIDPQMTVYVAFRSIRPDPVTWLDVLKKLLENNIDITQLRVWPTNHCQ